MDGIMGKKDADLKALYDTRDQYALAETVGALMPRVIGDLSHLRDVAARGINYGFSEMTSAAIAEGDEHLAEAARHASLMVAAIKRAHTSDQRVVHALTKGKVEVGMPGTDRIRKFFKRGLKATPEESFGR